MGDERRAYGIREGRSGIEAESVARVNCFCCARDGRDHDR